MIIERFPELQKLTPEEKQQLASELGGNFFVSEQPLSPEVIAELDRSMEEYRRDPSTGRTWEQVKARIAAGDWRQFSPKPRKDEP